MAKVNDEIAGRLASTIVDSEYAVGQQNNKQQDSDYLDYLDMFDCERSAKNYDWMSDIFFPEFYAQQLTQLSEEAGTFFKTHDFVEVYVGSKEEVHKRSARANKTLINRTLNRRDLYFYSKFMKMAAIKNMVGVAYMRCWWEQKTKRTVVGQKRNVRTLNTDVDGKPVINDDQVAQQDFYNEDVMGEEVLYDQFNFDIMDSRDVFTDSSYTHSMQDKRWIILRFEKTIDELESEAEDMEYFNLEKVRLDNEKHSYSKEVEGGRSTHHGIDDKEEPDKTPLVPYTVLQRLGKHLVIVEERDADGNPLRVKPGIDKDGEKVKGAEFHEMVITFVRKNQEDILIGYTPARTIDSNGRPYRPIGRSLCYIHPNKDDGFGDGKAARELQMAINDTINMEADRTKLATIPIMQGPQYNITDNNTLEWKPGAFWETEDGNVLQEVKVNGDVTGALNEVALYRNMSQQASGVSAESQAILAAPTTSATATANQVQQSDKRSDFRAFTLEFTGLSDLWWFITQMSAQFMKQETAERMIGKKEVSFFDPSLDFTYKPLSAALDSDSARQTKTNNWLQLYNSTVNSPNKNAPQALNYILAQISELQGKEYESFSDKFFLDENDPPPRQGGQDPSAISGQVPTNQTGMPQNQQEVQTRELMNSV